MESRLKFMSGQNCMAGNLEIDLLILLPSAFCGSLLAVSYLMKFKKWSHEEVKGEGSKGSNATDCFNFAYWLRFHVGDDKPEFLTTAWHHLSGVELISFRRLMSPTSDWSFANKKTCVDLQSRPNEVTIQLIGRELANITSAAFLRL